MYQEVRYASATALITFVLITVKLRVGSATKILRSCLNLDSSFHT